MPPTSALTPRARATRYPTRPAVPPPGRADEASWQAFRALWERVDGKTIATSEYMRLLGHDIDFHVPVFPEPVDGLCWPQLIQDERDHSQFFVHTYSREASLGKAQEAVAPERRQARRLSGVELLRWVWACPRVAGSIHVDAYQGTPNLLQFPSRYVLDVVYPHFIQVPALDAVPAVGLARLAALPGARGLDPEVVKALTQNWKRLLGTRARDDGPAPTVEHGGRACLPAFTGDDQFFAFGPAHREFRGRLAPAGPEPPFAAWLGAMATAQGVVLDAASPHPIVLEPTDLLALDLWVRHGRQPHGGDLVGAAGRLLTAGSITPRLAARVAADWPRYFTAVQGTATGGSALRTPDADPLPLFTEPSGVADYVAFHRTLGSLQGEWETIALLHTWTDSAFHRALDLYADGAWIDPPLRGGGGLRLDRAMVEAAIERVDEQLKPRVPGFVREF